MLKKNVLIHSRCSRSVADALAVLQATLETREIPVFAVIDHAENARGAGLVMSPTAVVLFGNPAMGTPLMLEAPTLALDLPLRILLWEDGEGSVWFSYHDMALLGQAHGLSADHEILRNMAVLMEVLARQICI